jgi:hypothetical protein
MELVMIFVAMQLRTRQDPHICLCLKLSIKDVSVIPTSIMVDLPAVWENFLKGIVAPIAEAAPLFYSTSILLGGLGLDKTGNTFGSFGCVNASVQARFLGQSIR